MSLNFLDPKTKFSRRKFLIGSAVTTAGAAVLLNGCQDEDNDNGDENSNVGVEQYVPKTGESSYVNTSCSMCGNVCAVRVALDKDKKPLRIIPNPEPAGAFDGLCAKGNSGLQQLNSPDRLKYPMKKVGDDEWVKVSWDEALDTVYENLKRVKEDYGPESVSFANKRITHKWIYSAFIKSYGSPNHEQSASICDGGQRVANITQYGTNLVLRDFKKAKWIMLVGAAPFDSARYTLEISRDIIHAQENGAKLIVVDPRLNYTGSMADEYIAVKPCTDAAFLLSMAQVIIEEDLHDKEFVEKYGEGFAEYAAEAKKEKYKPENAAEITGIPADTIKRIAREFATTEGALIESISGALKNAGGTLFYMAVNNLMALVGNIEKESGVNYISKSRGKMKWPEIGEDNVTAKSHDQEGGWGVGALPFEISRCLTPHAMFEPDKYPGGPLAKTDTVSIYGGNGIKALVLNNTDPMAAQPNTTIVKKGLQSLEFAVGIDIYWNHSMAHFPVGSIALPECTYLERWQLAVIRSFEGYTGLFQPVVEPMWDTKSSYWMFAKLGQKFGFKGFDQLDPDGEMEVVKKAITTPEQLDGTKVDWDTMVKNGRWIGQRRTFGKLDEYLLNGKYHFSLTQSELSGLQQAVLTTTSNSFKTPYYMEPLALSDKYPVRLMAGGKVQWHIQGASHHLPYLMQNFDDLAPTDESNYFFLNPATAAKYGVADRGAIIVTTKVGQLQGIARTSERIQKDLIQIIHGYGNESKMATFAHGKGVNPNYLVDNLRLDFVAGTMTPNEEICSISPA